MKSLWILFIAGQILNAGNMNYQQEAGYYELNSLMYGRHPSKETVYIVKAAETLAVYGITKIFPKHEKLMLTVANTVVWGVIIYDHEVCGVEFKFRF